MLEADLRERSGRRRGAGEERKPNQLAMWSRRQIKRDLLEVFEGRKKYVRRCRNDADVRGGAQAAIGMTNAIRMSVRHGHRRRGQQKTNTKQDEEQCPQPTRVAFCAVPRHSVTITRFLSRATPLAIVACLPPADSPHEKQEPVSSTS